MKLKENITWTILLASIMLPFQSCSEEEPYSTDNGSMSLVADMNHFGTAGQIPPSLTNGGDVRMDAYLFEDGILTNYFPDLKEENGKLSLPLERRNGTLYVLGCVDNLPDPSTGILTEAQFNASVQTDENALPPSFFTGSVNLKNTTGTSTRLSMQYGVARLDFRARVAGKISVKEFAIKNAVQAAYILPQPATQTPDGAKKSDILLTFDEGLQQDSVGLLYLYEQANKDLIVRVKAEIDGKSYELEQSLPEILKRNTAYTVTVRKDLSGIGLVVEEWEEGEGTQLIPSLDSRLTIDELKSQLSKGVQIAEEGTSLIFPHNASEVLLAVDCNDELELIPLDGYPLTVEPVTQTRGLEGKNLFRIRKSLYAPGMEADEVSLQFHRKGLDKSYPEDHIRLVLQANPVIMEGPMKFDAESYTHRFDRYIDNELGTFTIAEEQELIVEFGADEDPWMKVVPHEERANTFRVLAGWKPNDPTANGRVQEGKLVIRNKADGTDREEYTVSRRNYGLPVTWLHGIWWCKYNAKGNSRSFDDQVLSSNDPAVRDGKTVFSYLETCSAQEYYDLWGWSYQGDSGEGLRVINQDSIAVLDGFRTGISVHMNKLEPTTLAPHGYEVPSMEDFNRVFDATATVWVMWSGSHLLKNPWEGHDKILREQKRRNDIVIDGLAVSDLIYVAMKSPDFPQYEPVVWYGPAAQWNASGIYHGHYNNILFTVYAPNGNGWYFSGGMNGLYLRQNGAGNNDTRILRFKKSPVEYIYGIDNLP